MILEILLAARIIHRLIWLLYVINMSYCIAMESLTHRVSLITIPPLC